MLWDPEVPIGGFYFLGLLFYIASLFHWLNWRDLFHLLKKRPCGENYIHEINTFTYLVHKCYSDAF